MKTFQPIVDPEVARLKYIAKCAPPNNNIYLGSANGENHACNLFSQLMLMDEKKDVYIYKFPNIQGTEAFDTNKDQDIKYQVLSKIVKENMLILSLRYENSVYMVGICDFDPTQNAYKCICAQHEINASKIRMLGILSSNDHKFVERINDICGVMVECFLHFSVKSQLFVEKTRVGDQEENTPKNPLKTDTKYKKREIILLDPEAAHTKYVGIDENGGKTPIVKSPHARRGHIRVCASGIRVFVRPCWVGPREIMGPNKRTYEVLGI